MGQYLGEELKISGWRWCHEETDPTDFVGRFPAYHIKKMRERDWLSKLLYS